MNRQINEWYDNLNEPWDFLFFMGMVTPIIWFLASPWTVLRAIAALEVSILLASRAIWFWQRNR